MVNKVYRKEQGKGEGVSRPLAGLAYWRERGHEFRSLGAGRYEVPSRSRKGQRHEINVEYETCKCEDYTRRNPYNTPPEEIRPCAHIFAVVIAMSKPAPIPSRERFQFAQDQVMANLDRMEA